jgi:dihydrofolate reductase
MRQIIMFNRVSADGYFSDPAGGLDWFVPDDEIDRAGAASGPAFDTILFGRRTYEMFAAYWPTAGDRWPHGDRRSEDIRAMATFLNTMPKLVVSRTLSEATWTNARVLRDIEAIAAQPGQRLIVFGSASIVSQLTERGMIDEYHIVVCPIMLGGGRPLVHDVASRRLELVDATPYRSGNVLLRWRPSRS